MGVAPARGDGGQWLIERVGGAVHLVPAGAAEHDDEGLGVYAAELAQAGDDAVHRVLAERRTAVGFAVEDVCALDGPVNALAGGAPGLRAAGPVSWLGPGDGLALAF